MKEERFTKILAALKRYHTVTLEGLSRELQVSEDTVRRDIDYLSKAGLLVKVRGGAMSPALSPLSFEDREQLFHESKDSIALKACRLLSGVKTVFMDGGTTVRAIAARIPRDMSLRIITNNMAIVPLLRTSKDMEIIILGGLYNPETQTNLGNRVVEEVLHYQADLYLMGTCAIDPVAGITSSVQQDGEIKKAMLASARRTVALSNAEKLHTSDYFKVCSLSAVDTLITDLRPDDKRLLPFRDGELEIL